MFGFPIATALSFYKLIDNYGDRIEKIKSALIFATNSQTFKILSAMFSSFIFNLWAELFYGIVLNQIQSGLGRVAYLIFSGVIPVRIFLLLEPPFKLINFIFGIFAVILFLTRCY